MKNGRRYSLPSKRHRTLRPSHRIILFLQFGFVQNKVCMILLNTLKTRSFLQHRAFAKGKISAVPSKLDRAPIKSPFIALNKLRTRAAMAFDIVLAFPAYIVIQLFKRIDIQASKINHKYFIFLGKALLRALATHPEATRSRLGAGDGT